jgi:hypothetical protein
MNFGRETNIVRRKIKCKEGGFSFKFLGTFHVSFSAN